MSIDPPRRDEHDVRADPSGEGGGVRRDGDVGPRAQAAAAARAGYREPSVPVRAELALDPDVDVIERVRAAVWSGVGAGLAMQALLRGDPMVALLLAGATVLLTANSAARILEQRRGGVRRLRLFADGRVRLLTREGVQAEVRREELAFDVVEDRGPGNFNVLVRLHERLLGRVDSRRAWDPAALEAFTGEAPEATAARARAQRVWDVVQRASLRRLAEEHLPVDDEGEVEVEFSAQRVRGELRAAGLAKNVPAALAVIAAIPLLATGFGALAIVAPLLVASLLIGLTGAVEARLSLRVDSDGRATLARVGAGLGGRLEFAPGELGLERVRTPGREAVFVLRDGEERELARTRDLSDEEVGRLFGALERRPVPEGPRVRVAVEETREEPELRSRERPIAHDEEEARESAPSRVSSSG